jgi:uncharacterized protein (DUF305 family)
MQPRTKSSKRTIAAGCVTLALTALAACTEDDVTADAGSGPGQEEDAGQLDGGTPGDGDGDVDADAGTDGGGPPGAIEVEGDRRVPFTPANDRAFAEFFIEHHQMAVHMAEYTAENGADEEVKAMATQMAEAQTAEIAVLEAALADLADTDAPPAMPPDPHAEADMEHMMTLSGAELDQMFLIDMIAHHASALPTAHRATTTLEREDLKGLAEDMFEAQAKEIGEMRAMLVEMGVDSSGEDLAPAEASRPDFGLEGDRRIPLTPEDDIAFIDFFVTHHEMAMQMAEAEVARGADEEVKAMAQMMLTTQMAEVETMRTVRMRLAGDANSPSMPTDPHADPEMAAMEQMSGEELDMMFLMEMIPHHASALPTAHRALPHVMEAELRTLATEMFNAQAEEIGQMRAMLDARTGG